MKEKIHIIACAVLAPDIKHIVTTRNLNAEMKFLPGGLHNTPDELRYRLQKAVDQAAADPLCSRIVAGYGVCGRGTVGIQAPSRVPLVFPRVQDCIALFMGSDSAFRKNFEKYPGTFYISAGWYLEQEAFKKKDSDEIWVGSGAMGCREIKDRYGEEKGGHIIDFFTSWQTHYQRIAFIDTGIGSAEKSAAFAAKMAEKYNLAYQRITGSLSLLTKLLTRKGSDEEIVTIPPGHVTIFSALDNKLSSALDVKNAFAGNTKSRHLIFDHGKKQTDNIRYGLGIDAGGTYTDVVVYDFSDRKVSDKNKALTTRWDFSLGIDHALSELDAEALAGVDLVSVSTTLATNAIVEGRGCRVGLVLMTGSSGMGDDLISHTPKCVIKGQMSIGGAEIEPVDENEVIRAVRQMVTRDRVEAFAVSGFAGSVNPAHELSVKAIISRETQMMVCCGHELSDLLNFAVRAQTAVLNARIVPEMIRFFKALTDVLKKRGIQAPVMIVKGDGTLISLAMARERPVETILSGPAASAAGAAFLTGLDQALVVDMGGTTTDTADISRGRVDICETGAIVGGIVTHVKALDMHTAGFGGDSLICWKENEFLLGPCRVCPVSRAGSENPSGIDTALQFMENHPFSSLSQTIFLARQGRSCLTLSDREKKIYELLLNRPYTPEELLSCLDVASAAFLPLSRLEDSGLVIRCGLTPTDLLHVKGLFNRWDTGPARHMVRIMTGLSSKTEKEVISFLFDQMETRLALEMLKKQMTRDFKSETLENNPAFSELMKKMVRPEPKNVRYGVRAEFKHPIIGIGAPVHCFLPNAGERLHTKVIIPEHADVANAVGAVTSRIVIKQKLSIKTDSSGQFVVEGAAGNHIFCNIAEAEAWALKYLRDQVLTRAKKAGTSCEIVSVDIRDRLVNTAKNIPLFLGRSIEAKLSGTPDMKHGPDIPAWKRDPGAPAWKCESDAPA